MDATEILAKALQQEIDQHIMEELLINAEVPKEELVSILQDMKDRDSDELYRAIYDLTPESIHKIENE